MNPVDRILGKRIIDVSRDREYIDKYGNVKETGRDSNKTFRKITRYKTSSMFNPHTSQIERVDVPYQVWIPVSEKKEKVDVKDKIYSIIDNQNLTIEEKRRRLLPYKTYMKENKMEY